MALARIRTIREAAQYIKEQDPQSALGETYLRNLILRGKLKCHRAGNRYLVDITRLEEYLANPPEEETPAAEFGTLRKIQQVGRR